MAAFGYAPRPTALGRAGAGAAAIHLWAFAAVAFVTPSPIVLTGCMAAVTIAGIAAGARSALVQAARWGAMLGLVLVAVNAIAAQRGATILVRGPDLPVLGTVDVSAEALAEGGVLVLRVMVVFAAFAIYTACVDPDRLLRIVRPLARRSALTASLVTRLAPLAAVDYARMREAHALRGPAAAPIGRGVLMRRLVAGSLDRAIDVAATLELRGWAAGPPCRAGARPRAPGDWAFALSGLIALAAVVTATAAGAAGYESYPTIAVATGPPALALAAGLPALALAPLLLDRLRRRSRATGLAHA